MKKKKNNKKILKLIFIIIVIAFFATLFLLSFSYSQKSTNTRHVSEDLKISLDYPKGWYIDDRDYAILLTNYYTTLNRNDKPSNTQIELYIRNFPSCHPTIEEDLKDPGCGEGGPAVRLGEIISKEIKELSSGKFYRYVVKYQSGDEFTYYLLENEARIIKISKQPDPSQHEQEFEEIIESIRFLQ